MKINKDRKRMEEQQGETLCEVCGSIKVLEDGEYICPSCDVKIDYFGDDNADDN